MIVMSLEQEKNALANRLGELHGRRQLNMEQRAVLEEIDVDVEDVRRARVDPAEQLRRIARHNYAIRRRLEEEEARLSHDIETLQDSIRELDRKIGTRGG